MSASIQSRVTATEAEIAAIKERLASIESLDPSAIIAALTERLAALESKPETKRGRPPKPKAKAEPAESKPKPPADAPGPEHYRLSSYDETLCMARKLKPSGQDRHWSPVVYHESQCTGKPVEGESGEGLCTSCCTLRDKEMEAGKLKHWNGRIDEDPAQDDLLTHSVHMLGTEWGKKCEWSSEASPVKSVKGASEEKAVAKAAASAAKEAAKAAKAAEKEAEKEAKKAAKEAAKEAASAAKKAAKESKPAAKAEKPKKEKAAKAPEGVAAAEEQVAGADYTMLLIDGELRVTKNGNVYELDELTQMPGDFLGRLIGTTEAPAIDADADEVVESDAE